MVAETSSNSDILANFGELTAELYARCVAIEPNFGVTLDGFRFSLAKGARKFLFTADSAPPTRTEIEEFLQALNHQDLFLAIACADGNERAWWEFDQQHRNYLERVARHLASTEVNADEVVDSVYVELYGTRIVDGVRQSKFASYSGRGSLRGWLRTIVWHALVDLHRASHDEISLDEMTENVGEGQAQAAFLNYSAGGESAMVDEIVAERYRAATLEALENSFASLDDHEKLLLMFYHVDTLKLREIARLVEAPDSPLRNWFTRRSNSREKTPNSKVHESTVMRWLEKTYEKVLQTFRTQLTEKNNFKQSEINLCVDLAVKDISPASISTHLTIN